MIDRYLFHATSKRNPIVYQLAVVLKKCLEGWERWLPKVMRVPDQRGHIQTKLSAAEKNAYWKVGAGGWKGTHD